MRILSVDGGGYLGLATAAFLKETERHFGCTYYENFDLFCGTSTGAIIALALATGMSGDKICEMYEDLGKRVFYNPVPGLRHARAIRSIAIAKYSNKRLREALESAFGDLTLGDVRSRGKLALVTAFSITTGTPRVFKTDHSEDLSRDDGYLLRDVALASSAAPTFLPVVKLKSPISSETETYCDGGVFANHPALMGYAEAVSHLGQSSKEISVLSLSTPRDQLGEWASNENFVRRFCLSRGLGFWRTKIFSTMIDSTSIASHQTLRRLINWDGSNRYVRIEFDKPKGVEMDKVTKKTTQALLQLGSTKAYDNEIRHEIAPYLTVGRIKQ